MESSVEEYIKNGYTVFSMGIGQKKQNNVWKKELYFPRQQNWRNLVTSYVEKDKNGLAMETGLKNNIIVIDIDKPSDWQKVLKRTSKQV